MPTKPDLPRWAAEDQVDPISGQNNVIEPPTERKESGWTRHEAIPRQWWNWLHRKTFEWLQFLDETRGQLEIFSIAELPAASDNEGRLVYVSDISEPAYSDGADWRRVTDGSTI